MQTKSNHLVKLWAMPTIVAVITLIGLILAIMGTGIWHVLSWVTLSYPLYLICRYGVKFYK